jgi:predicted ester cyclase
MDTQITNSLKSASPKLRLFGKCFSAAVILTVIAPFSSADVKSLTSSELTQTYIKDSTVIITPKVKKKSDQESQTKDQKLTSLTISPGEAPVTPEEKQYEFGKITQDSHNQIKGAIANADEQTREAAFAINKTAIASAQPAVPEVTFQNARVGGVPGLVIPSGDFNMNFLGSELGLSRSGDQLKFSFGNIPGIGAIRAPQSINENGIKLQPRQGGGFDLTFTVPKQ